METTKSSVKQLQTNVINDPSWIQDYSILFRSDRALEFVPTLDMTNSERLNAISRFVIYFSLLLIIITHNLNVAFIAIIGLIIIYIIYKGDSQLQLLTADRFDSQIKQQLGIPQDLLIGVDKSGNICKRPTPHNPFMNITMDEYLTQPNRPPPCNHSDPAIQREVKQYFDYNLYKDVNDVWDRNNSQRQFVSLPGQTIPNDRDSYQRWLYGQRGVCRDGDQQFCLQYENPQVPGYS